MTSRVVLFIIYSLSCLNFAVAQVSNPDLVAQAKKEGRVTWYTTVSIPESKQFIDMFEKQYPFIKVDLLRSGSGPLVNRIVSEYAAKNYAADVLQGMSTAAATRCFGRETLSLAMNRPSANIIRLISKTRKVTGLPPFKILLCWRTTREV